MGGGRASPGIPEIIARRTATSLSRCWLTLPSIECDRMLLPETGLATPEGSCAPSRLEGRAVMAYAGGALPEWSVPRSVASRTHRGPILRLELASGRVLRMTAEHRVFVKVGSPSGWYDLLLVRRAGLGSFVGVGVTPAGAGSCYYDSAPDGASSIEEDVWILSRHASLDEAVYGKHRAALRFGLPRFDLDPALRDPREEGDLVETLLREVDTRWRERQCLEAHRLSPAHPHLRRMRLNLSDCRDRRHIEVSYFWHLQQPSHAIRPVRHRLLTYSLDRSVRLTRGKISFMGPGEPLTELYEDAEPLEVRARHLEAQPGVKVERRIHLADGRQVYVAWPASLLRERMSLPRFDGRRVTDDAILRLVEEEHAGEVYGIELPGGHPLVIDDLVVGSTDHEPPAVSSS